MDRMLVVVFDTESKAYEGKRALLDLDSDGSIVIYASAVVAKNADGTRRFFNRVVAMWPTQNGNSFSIKLELAPIGQDIIAMLPEPDHN